MSTQTDFLAVLDQNCEYPGQTMMVALAILVAFPSHAQASGHDDGTPFSRAARSFAVPGAGCAVGAALDTLKQGIQANWPADQAIAELHARWRQYAGHQPDFAAAVQPGIDKAQPYEAEFQLRWETWKHASVIDAHVSRAGLVAQLTPVDASEVGWALDTLHAGAGVLNQDELESIASALCKANDHDTYQAAFSEPMLALEAQLVTLIQQLRRMKDTLEINT